MHRRSKPGLFSQKSIKAGVWVEVGTTDQQWGFICVGDTQVLLCYPIQDGQGIVTSWGVSLCPRSSVFSWELVCASSVPGRGRGSRGSVTVQTGALSWQQLEHSPRLARACWGISEALARAPSLGERHCPGAELRGAEQPGAAHPAG